MFPACPTGRSHCGRPRTQSRVCVSKLAWKHLGVPMEELKEVARKRDDWASLSGLLSPRAGQVAENRWWLLKTMKTVHCSCCLCLSCCFLELFFKLTIFPLHGPPVCLCKVKIPTYIKIPCTQVHLYRLHTQNHSLYVVKCLHKQTQFSLRHQTHSADNIIYYLLTLVASRTNLHLNVPPINLRTISLCLGPTGYQFLGLGIATMMDRSHKSSLSPTDKEV